MSEHHCWYVLRRAIRVATALVLIVSTGWVASALAVEASTPKTAKTVAVSTASEALDNAETAAPEGEAATVSSVPTVARDDAPGGYAFPESDEVFDLILRLQRKRDVLSPAIIGLQKNFDYYLPVVEIARAVKFPVQADIANGIVTGSFLNDQNTFSINARTRTATVVGKPVEIPEGSIIVRDHGQGIGDIYVTAEVLNQIWPLALEVDFSELSVYIKTRQKLAYELERERKKRQQDLEGESEEETPVSDNHFYVPNDYKTYSPHTFNIDETLLWDGHENEARNNLNVYGQGDLLGTTADYTINLESDRDGIADLKNARLRFTRRDFGTGTLPLGLKIAQVGDISAKPSPLIEKVLAGRGAYVSSDPSRRNQSFDDVVVEGTAAPGWEVEVYRGQELLDFGTVDEKGVYRFENIPLNYGNNQIRIVLYGPQGEVEERIEDYSIGHKMLRPGETNFEAGIVDLNQSLIDLGDDPEPEDTLAKTVRVNRGINHWMTGFATATETPTKEGAKQYLTAGAAVNALGGKGQIEAYQEIGGGNVLDTRFARKFAGISTNIRASVFRGFESRDSGFGDQAKTFEGEFRAARSFNLPFGQLGLNAGIEQTRLESGRRTTQFRTLTSLGLPRVQLSNTTSTQYTDGDKTSTTGTFSANTGFGPHWRFRTALDYTQYPESELDQLRNELRYLRGDNFTASLNVNQGLKDDSATSVGLGASYDFGTFLGGADINWDSEGTDFMLRASTVFGPDGDDRNYIFTTDYEGYNTALKVRVFQDNDMNGEFGAGDQPVPRARVRINGRRSDPANEEGYIEILGAGEPGLATITIDRDSLPDQFLSSLRDGYKTVLRQGTKPFIDFALIMTGSIDGTVRAADGTPLPGLIVQLVDQSGNVVMEAPSVYDGFYVFEFVKPGNYTVRLAPSHQVFVPPQSVTVTSMELIAYGVDLQVSEQAAEVPVTEEPVGSGIVAHTYRKPPVTEGTKQPAPLSSGDRFQPVVGTVRIGEYPHKVRLVLDLSGPAGYSISREKDKPILYVDLPQTTWNAQRDWTTSPNSLISKIDALALPGGGTRLRLEARKDLSVFYNAILPPDEGKGYRLCVDFMPVAE